MTELPQCRAGDRGQLTRRSLLGRGMVSTSALGAAALLPAAAGCTPSDPRVQAPGPMSSGRSGASSGPGSSSVPPGRDGADPAAASEQALADLTAAILAGPNRAQLSGAQRRTLTAVRDGHRQHSAALGGPTTAPAPPQGSSAGITTLSLPKSIQLLASQEQQQGSRLQGAALAADGPTALLRGSMMVADTGYAGALRGQRGIAAVASSRLPTTVGPVSDVVALQSVVRQLHALVYGYQVALGQLSESSPAGRQALAGLAARRQLRDRLTEILVSRAAAVPVAAGAYVPVIQPTSATTSQVLLRRMETAFEPFCGLWLASAARPDDRRLALGALADTTDAAQLWGAAVGPWPGLLV